MIENGKSGGFFKARFELDSALLRSPTAGIFALAKMVDAGGVEPVPEPNNPARLHVLSPRIFFLLCDGAWARSRTA